MAARRGPGPGQELLRDAPDFAISRSAKPQPTRNRPQGAVEMHIDPKQGHPDMDYSEHLRTYQMFCKGTLYLTASVAVLMGLMAYFLT
jgi:Bacterial aa3 type cytochrome c oxidase subunit IV